MKIVVFTVIIGPCDSVKPVLEQFKDDADYFLITDQDIGADSGYRIMKVPGNVHSSRRESRKYKIQPFKYFPGYEYSLYMDGSIELLSSPITLVEKYLKHHNIAAFKHPWRNCIYQEFKACRKYNRLVDPAIARRQELFYKREKYPVRYGLTENGVLLRRNETLVRRFDRMWWSIYSRYTERDQLSFCYCAWKVRLKYNTFEGDLNKEGNRLSTDFRINDHQ